MIINGDYFCPHTLPVAFRRGGGESPAPLCRVAARPGSGRQEMGWGEGRTRESLHRALGAGLQGAGEPRTRVKGEAERGVAQPGLSPSPPQFHFFLHAGRPLLLPTPPAPPSFLPHPPPAAPAFPRWGGRYLLGGRIVAQVMAAARQRRVSTAARLRPPPQAGRGERGATVPLPRGGAEEGAGEGVNLEPQPSSPRAAAGGLRHPRGGDGLTARLCREARRAVGALAGGVAC